ncbi:hypothetical protein GGS23DRAFT_597044 [Durotheca rogersii]|uniref:uncharacterized protein n=1 Tax=Durotheca rogersii TaxID=419775 RepID=UPI00222031A7|nr:uncharacterized protein GGS23DRAFT_597044 [Durotheca rogersii]KAI5863289.1 hypothetical protein GGS23DRAFT_597044 [Durotheca rogersii]
MATQPTKFDHRGDVKLRIGRQGTDSAPAVFTVCSRSLARVSPVFERMLYGGFAEARSNQANDAENWIVDLPEDKPAPMEVLMIITHGHFDQVPKSLSIRELYDLTVLTHYYDATHMLGPWAKTWMATIEKQERESVELRLQMLWISWELGWKQSFAAICRRMLLESEADAFDVDNNQSMAIQFPPDIIERISALRIKTIQALLDTFSEMVSNLTVVDEKPRWCHHATWMGPHKCESMILGSLTFCLMRAGLWPVPDAAEVGESVMAVYSKTTNIIIHDIGTADNSHVDHNECNPGPFLLERVQNIMGQIPSPVTDSHLQYMTDQARKLNS